MITTSFLHGLGEKYEDFVIMILSIRGKDEKGQLLEPDLDSVMEQLMDKERRQVENGQSENSFKALKARGNYTFCHSPKHHDKRC